MSLVSQALVTVVRKALTGRTWAAGNVLEQPVDPLAEMIRDGQGEPYLAIYSEQTKGEPTGTETQSGVRQVKLKLIAYVPPKVVVEQDEVSFEFDNTGAGLLLNLIGRQADAALHYGNSTWVDLFRKFVLRVEKVETRYLLIELENGVRVPALEACYEVQSVPEPEFGKPLYGAWLQLDTTLRVTTEGAKVADMFKALIESPADLPDYQQFQMSTNLSDAAFRSTGLDPLAVDDEGAPPTVDDVGADPDIDVGVPVAVP